MFQITCWRFGLLWQQPFSFAYACLSTTAYDHFSGSWSADVSGFKSLIIGGTRRDKSATIQHSNGSPRYRSFLSLGVLGDIERWVQGFFNLPELFPRLNGILLRQQPEYYWRWQLSYRLSCTGQMVRMLTWSQTSIPLRPLNKKWYEPMGLDQNDRQSSTDPWSRWSSAMWSVCVQRREGEQGHQVSRRHIIWQKLVAAMSSLWSERSWMRRPPLSVRSKNKQNNFWMK